VGNIVRAVITLRGSLADVTNGLKTQSGNLFTSAEQLSVSSSDTMHNMKEIEKAVSEMASGATMQAEETQRATENVIDIGNMIEATYANTKVLSADADSMKKLGQDATQILNELVEGQQVMVDNINVVYAKTQEANTSAKRISEVVELITELASETNLLSLNASIEAARAGEAGRGFAVVAENIKKLAEQTTESATDINAIIQELESRSEETVEKTDAVKDIVDKQETEMQRTADIVRNVITNINHLIERIDDIVGNIQQMDEAKENVVDVIQNLSAVSQENAAATEETSASTVLAMNTMQSIADNAGKLRTIAEGLDEEMKKFKL
jgi:methyl-accepting chemotaxis protein